MERMGWRGVAVLTLMGAALLANRASAQTTEASSTGSLRLGPRAAVLDVLSPDWRPEAGSADAYAAGGGYGTTNDVRRYWRGRREPQYGNRGIAGWFDIRGGFFDTQDVSKNDWTLGVKAMGKVTPQLSLGMSTDLHRRSEAERIVTSQYTDPTGHVVTTSSTAFDASSNLVPLMGVLELHVPAVGIDPYFGAAGGWEFLNVQVRDFTTGEESEANYDGPGYQLFGGVGVPIGQRARFVGEAYWNGSTVKRDVIDPSTGFLVQERIGVDGGGVRAGLGFAF